MNAAASEAETPEELARAYQRVRNVVAANRRDLAILRRRMQLQGD